MKFQELSFELCEKYMSVLDEHDPKSMDELIKLMDCEPSTCFKIHDFIAKISKRFINTDTFLFVKSIKDQLKLVDQTTDKLRDVLEGQSGLKAGMTLKDITVAMKSNLDLSMKLRKEITDVGNRAKSEDAIAYVLTEFMRVLRELDPVVAVRVRDGAVKQFDELVSVLPIIPGKD